MSVPRSEFTFTASEYNERTRSPFSFPWDRTETLAGSDLQSSSLPRSPPRADQPPVFQFEGLNIANQSSAFPFGAVSIGNQSRFTTPSIFRRDESLLTPTRSASTYADQHNASPSPGSSRIAHRRIHQTRQRSVGSGLSTVTNPHENPVESMESEIHSDSTEMSHTLERSVSVVSRESRTSIRGAIRDESLPNVPIYDARLQDQVKEVKSKLTSLVTSIGSSALVHDQSSSLHAHYQKVKKASKFEYPEIRTVGFIGDSGVGKSSLINSLLDQRGLSRSSSDGAACTCVVTEFRHTDDTHTGPYTVEAEFMTTREMRDLLEELLLNFRAWFVPSARHEIESEAERQECQGAAERAWGTFRSLFKSQPGLTMSFLSDDNEGADEMILRELERWAYSGLKYRPGGAQALEYSATANDVWECQELLDMLTADYQRNHDPALWPFVKITRVFLSSPVLRTGLVVADLPGFRDMNFARVRATERYLKHNCDEVFIVADISRVHTGDSVHNILKRCKDDQPRRIVCTRSEDVSAEEAARPRDENGRRVREMNRNLERIRNSIEGIEIARENEADRDNSELALRESQLRDRERTLTFEITQFLVNQRNNKVSQELMEEHAGVRVFCISNPLYTKWRASRTHQAEAYVNLSGILELRRYCQLVPAEAQLLATRTFFDHEVKALLLSLRQWVLAGADSVTAERATALRGLIDNVEKALVRGTTSPQAYVARMQGELKVRYNTLINDFARSRRGQWKTQGIETSEEWESWHHSTYKVYCAHYGTYSTEKQPNRSWNDELMHPVRRQLDPQWEMLVEWLESEIDSSAQDISALFQRASIEIGADSIHLAPLALRNLLHSILSRKDYINHYIEGSIRDFMKQTELLKTDMLYGHASSYMSDLMRPAYVLCIRESGGGSHQRRKNIMYKHLDHGNIFHDVSRVTLVEYKKILVDSFKTLQETLNEEIVNITRDLHAVVTDAGQLHEAQREPELARELKLDVEDAMVTLANAQNVMETVVRQFGARPPS
ncbi:hypothetical protein N7488_005340 [Penicillium malachiteum]|nr:hypothetical protein N7488_005340 [Penicillium malachiteum]